MSVQKSHVYVLAEDDANRQILNGFLTNQAICPRCVKPVPTSKGWSKMVDQFQSDYVPRLRGNPLGFVILLVDFDGQGQKRADQVWEKIDDDVKDRVFILGSKDEPERLRLDLGTYETIGQALAKDCHEGKRSTWDHEFLCHNASELDRLWSSVRPFLFTPSTGGLAP